MSKPNEAQTAPALAPMSARPTPEPKNRWAMYAYRNKSRPPWTHSELVKLREIYRGPDYVKEAAEILQRTVNAVYCKASEHGLNKNLPEWSL